MRAPSPTLVRRQIFRLLVCLPALLLLACAEDEPVEPDDRVTVKLTFDQVTYVDANISPRRLLERVKNQARSIFPALRKLDVMVLGNQEVVIEPVKLKRVPMTVVDVGPEGGSRPQPTGTRPRSAQRVRFHYVTLALVPKALADRPALDLGVLHGSDGSRAETVLAECSANGERERQSVRELWMVFDASLPSCAEAMAREQAAIDDARKKLAHPDREIVPAELDRLYLPLPAHLKRRQQPGSGHDGGDPLAQAGSQESPGPQAGSQESARPQAGSQESARPQAGSQEGPGPQAGPQESARPQAGSQAIPHPPGPAGDNAAPAEDEQVADPTVRAHAPDTPGVPAVADDNQDGFVFANAETEGDLEDAEDEKELRKMDRAVGADLAKPPPTVPVFGSATYLQPNYAFLYVAIIAFVLLLVGQRRRQGH
jgi:hypothetical protein